MNAFFKSLKSAAQKRSAYKNTYRELSTMDLDTAIDLGLFISDAQINARKAVYGY